MAPIPLQILGLDFINTLAVPLIASLLVFSITAVYSTISHSRMSRDINEVTRRSNDLIERLEQHIVKEPYEKKKAIFLTRPRLFYYLDSSTVESLYNEIAPSIRTTHLEKETRRGSDKGIQGSLGLTGNYQKRDEKIQREVMEISENIESKYDSIIRYLLEHEVVDVAIDEFSNNEQAESSFLKVCEEIYDKFSYEIPADVRQNFVKISRRRLADDKIKEIQSCTGYVLISQRFDVKQSTDQGWKLIYRHPISDALGSEVNLEVDCLNKHMKEVGAETFQKANSVQLSIFGRIISYQDNLLTVKPLGIH